MLSKLAVFFRVLCAEPPFRLFSRALIKRLPVSMRIKCTWDAVERPHYLLGVLRAVDQAKKQGVPEICVAEFGVARGDGLFLLERYAALAEAEEGIRIRVYGFDTGQGLPPLCGDYRDHPDFYRIGDYPSNVAQIQSRLSSRSKLIIGNVDETVERFVTEIQSVPLGFASIDVDFYTSTRDALVVLSHPRRNILRRVVLYFDELDLDYFHQFAGEFLAINEFNQHNAHVKLDRWHGVNRQRPFPENHHLLGMYIAHDLEAISKVTLNRTPVSHAT